MKAGTEFYSKEVTLDQGESKDICNIIVTLNNKNLVNLAVCATAHNQERFVFITTSTHDLSCLVMSN